MQLPCVDKGHQSPLISPNTYAVQCFIPASPQFCPGLLLGCAKQAWFGSSSIAAVLFCGNLRSHAVVDARELVQRNCREAGNCVNDAVIANSVRLGASEIDEFESYP